jgi:hypothetical protein
MKSLRYRSDKIIPAFAHQAYNAPKHYQPSKKWHALHPNRPDVEQGIEYSAGTVLHLSFKINILFHINHRAGLASAITVSSASSSISTS